MMVTHLPKAAENALRFEEKILPNGLAVRLLPMPEYGASHVIYATKFGSIDRSFEGEQAKVDLPAGVAHFLEHKMFENEDGVDAFTLYGKTGASANAYTGFDRTSYIFTATERMEENLDILLSFVGHPHFTQETVAKEQGIIGQEIKMYEDHAELRCVFALLECLYHNHPVRDEIVGSVESISQITPQLLYSCSEAFYNPGNMALCAAGRLHMEQLLQAVEKADLAKAKTKQVKRLFPEEPPGVYESTREFMMPVAMPLFGLGFKEAAPQGDTTKLEVVCDLLTELISGETSTLYRSLYDEGLVQPGFGGEFGCFSGCLHFLFTGEGEQPERVRQSILDEIERMRREGIDREQFETCKRMMYGEAIADLENVERVASMLSSSYFHGRTPAAALDALATVTAEDIEQALSEMLHQDRSAFVVVRPEG
ncbi:insulinase family protein [Ruminococcaceae bacterium OttesenSCG-928-I18]|nr:insulinase family protein [Ruminococcaceae bacterium OttesenSCG-928-I18]